MFFSLRDGKSILRISEGQDIENGHRRKDSNLLLFELSLIKHSCVKIECVGGGGVGLKLLEFHPRICQYVGRMQISNYNWVISFSLLI